MSIISEIEDKHIQGFELEDKIHDGENVVGCFYKNSGTINLININKQYDKYRGKEIDFEGFGRWYIDDIVPKQEKISSQLKLYDLSHRFDSEYKLSKDIFPCTNLEWAQAICTDVGLELGSTNFPNSESILNEQPYLPEKATNRDAMKMIAGSGSCFVQIGWNKKVYIRWFEDTVVNVEDWFKLSQNPETKPINVVILGRGSVEDNIKYPTVIPENPIELRIDDNQILYFNREKMIVPIYNQVNGFKFFPFKMETDGKPALRAGMKVKYNDIDGMQVETPVMYHKIQYKGGIGVEACYRSIIESYELKETNTKYEYAGSIEKRLTDAERICDKNNNQIIDIVKEQVITNNKITNITNTQGQAEGKNIHIEDSAEEPFVEIELYGETNQKTRSGKNVLKSTINSQTKNGLDITVNADRSILINGTATVNTSIDLSSDFKLEAGTYTLSGCPQGGSNSTYRLYLNAVSGQDFGDGEGKVVSLSGEKSTRGIISISAGVNCSNLLFKPQLEKGNTVTDYEGNGVMPSPEYPSEIENLEGNIEFKVEGKNIFDFENILYNNNCKISGTADNFTVSKNVVGTYEYIIWDIGIITQNNYYLNFNSNRDGNSNIGAVYVSLDGTYANRKSILTLKNNLENYKLNVSDYQNYHLFIMFRADIPEEYENQSITNLMVCKEIITSDYEPHKSQVEYFPLEEGEKLHKGILLNGNGKNHTRNQYVITGQENWYEYTASGEYSDNLHCYFGLNDVVLDSKMAMKSSICTHFRNPGTWVIVPSVAQYGTYQDNPNTRHRYFITDIPTLAEWKAYLAEEYAKGTPVILEYDLAEPETIPYTEVQQEAWNKIEALMTYKNITNITSDAYAKVVYMRDNGLGVYETKQNASKKYTETAEKLVEQKMTVDGVITQVSETNKRLTNDYMTAEQVNAELDTTKDDIEILKQNQVTMTQTSKNLQIAIDTINTEGVAKVKTSMGYTFDDEGFKLNRLNAETGTIIDEAAVQVIDKTGASEQNLLYAGYVKEGNTNYPAYVGQTIVAGANMIVRNYLVIPNSRFEEYTNPVLGGKGTGAFEV